MFISKLFVFGVLLISSVQSLYLRNNNIQYLLSNYCIKDIEKFIYYVEKYNKLYSNENQLIQAFKNYIKNNEFIMNHNSSSYQLELNEHFDMDEEQFISYRQLYSNFQFLEYYSLKTIDRTLCKPYKPNVNSLVYDSIDWRSKAVTSVKDQGQCGSCWSFSSAGAMEGAHAIATGELIDISEQQLMDCSWTYGDFGCNGGLMDNAFQYAIDNGMCLEKDVPYLAKNQKCKEMPDCERVASFSYCFDVTPNNQQDLLKAVSEQPVSIAIEADTKVFQFYKSGIIDSYECGTNLDHGVLIVGYGEEDGQMYWNVKNSWGTGWGENGYVRIARSNEVNDPGICGIAMQPSFIVV